MNCVHEEYCINRSKDIGDIKCLICEHYCGGRPDMFYTEDTIKQIIYENKKQEKRLCGENIKKYLNFES